MLILFKPPENKGFCNKKRVSDLTLPLKERGNDYGHYRIKGYKEII